MNRNKAVMHLSFLLVSAVVVLSLGLKDVEGQTNMQFGYDIHPEKLLENSAGTIQIYTIQNKKMVPIEIEDLKVTSSDNQIVRILSVEPSANYVTDVKIETKEPGLANVAIAAPGYSSIEVPVEVYTNNKHPTKLFIKITPDDFPVDGPKRGYVSVELATTDGFPVTATEDILISINTPNNEVISLQNTELVIKQGDYYALGEFVIKNPGDAIVFAESEGMKRVSDLVHVREAPEPLIVKLYAYPSTLNSMVNSEGYVIAQLQDSDGVPLQTTRDIRVSLQVTNPDASLNTSRDFEELLFSEKIITIKEGSYWGYTSFTPRPDLEKFTTNPMATYEISLSTEDFVVEGTSVNVIHEEALIGEGPAVLETVPILTTGKSELVGVVHLFSDVPVMANEDLLIPVESSHSKTVKGSKVSIKNGKNSGLVFATTGSLIPKDDLFLYVTDSSGTSTVMAQAEGPLEDNLSLVVEPMVSKILANEKFPLLSYTLESEDEDETTTADDEDEENGRIGVTHFIQNGVLTFSANELVDIEPVVFSQGQDYVIAEGDAVEVGKTTLEAQGSGFDTNTAIDVLSTDPSKLHISYPDTILPNSKGKITIQTLDIGDNPAYAKNSIEFTLVSNNEIVSLPDTVVIDKDDYNTSFDFESLSVGKSEVSVLANDIPLTKFTLDVIEINSDVSLNVPKYAKIEEEFVADLTIQYGSFDLPLDVFNVEWNVAGGEILESDKTTNKNGVSKVTIIPHDVKEVSVSATVSSGELQKTVKGTTLVVKPQPVVEPEIPEPLPEESETEMDYTLLIIFGAIAAVVVGVVAYLKKTDRFDDIADRFDDFKDRMPERK